MGGIKGNGEEWRPDFSLLLAGEDNRQEMLGLFVSESRKGHRQAVSRRERKGQPGNHFHPPQEPAVVGDGTSGLSGGGSEVLVKSDAGQWEDKEYVKIEKIIGAVRGTDILCGTDAERETGMKTILILEDDVIFSRSIGNWLKKKGMVTEHATTLSAARKAPFRKGIRPCPCRSPPAGREQYLPAGMDEREVLRHPVPYHDQLRAGGERGGSHAAGGGQLPVQARPAGQVAGSYRKDIQPFSE